MIRRERNERSISIKQKQSELEANIFCCSLALSYLQLIRRQERWSASLKLINYFMYSMNVVIKNIEHEIEINYACAKCKVTLGRHRNYYFIYRNSKRLPDSTTVAN